MRNRNWKRQILWIVLLTGVLTPVRAPGQDNGSHIAVGSQVIPKSRAMTLRVGNKVVASTEVVRVLRVERIDRDWLWVVAEGLKGWVRARDVVPLDQAVAFFAQEIQSDPRDPWAYQMRGLVYYLEHNYDKALADADAALDLDPKDAVAYHNRGNVRLALHDYNRAIADYNRATELDSKDASSYLHRALAWSGKHEYDLAIADINEAIRLEPSAVKYRQRAVAWIAKQEYDLALADYNQAVKLNPDDAASYNARAWIWATSPDPKLRDGRKAVESARRAVELTNGAQPYYLGTLAAAYAESGDFKEAVRWQSQALERFPHGNADQAGHRRRLALYEAGKPYREDIQK